MLMTMFTGVDNVSELSRAREKQKNKELPTFVSLKYASLHEEMEALVLEKTMHPVLGHQVPLLILVWFSDLRMLSLMWPCRTQTCSSS